MLTQIPSVASERLSALDRAWLNMERARNSMVILALIVLAKPLAAARLKRRLLERLASIERFRCVPVIESSGTRWEACAGFDIDDHALATALPAPGGRAELAALASELASTPLNPSRPLWSFHLVEHYGQGSALIVRFHHCYADGVALVRVLLGLADRRNASDSSANGAAGVPRDAFAGTVSATPTLGSALLPQVLTGTWNQLSAAVGSASSLLAGLGRLLDGGVARALDPAHLADTSRATLGFAGELARIAAMPEDHPSALRRNLSGIRHVAWADPLSLEEVKIVGRALGCTVNDVLMSTLAGALGRLLARGEDVATDRKLRAVVPVNLRASQGDDPLGNRFGLMFVELPVGIRHPLSRLYAVHESAHALKASAQPYVTLALLAAFGSLPKPVEDLAIDLFSAKASLVASNLPGPPAPLYLAGSRISEMLFWVPQSGSIGLGVSMLSYDGRVQFGVIADRNVVPRPDALVRLIAQEFDRLVYVVLLGGRALADPDPDRSAAAHAQRRGGRARASRQPAPRRPARST